MPVQLARRGSRAPARASGSRARCGGRSGRAAPPAAGTSPPARSSSRSRSGGTGSAAACSSPSTVTWRSAIPSSSADCAFGSARLISSTRRTFAKIGPGRNSNRRSCGSQTERPVTSVGCRSGRALDPGDGRALDRAGERPREHGLGRARARPRGARALRRRAPRARARSARACRATTVSMLPRSVPAISVALPSAAEFAAPRSTLVMSAIVVEPSGEAAVGGEPPRTRAQGLTVRLPDMPRSMWNGTSQT